MGNLAYYDELRSTDRAEALEGYAALQDEIAADDAERILWIADQVAPTPPAALDRLFARVPLDGDPLLVRAATHARAMIAWFAGRSEDAERRWTRGVTEPGAPRDKFWLRSCLNLAMAFTARGCLFEPLVLFAMGARAAQDSGKAYFEAYAAFSRASLLLEMDDIDRAQEAAHTAREAAARLTEEAELRVVDYMRFEVHAELASSRGALKIAHEERQQQLAWLEAYGHVENAILAEVQGRILALQYALDPSTRDATLAALATLPERYELGPSWAGDGRRDLLELQARHGVEGGDVAAAQQAARALIDDLREDPHASRRVRRAARLGRLLSEPGGDAALAREALELASHASLMRVLNAERVTREIPLLAEATPADWEVLRDFRRRLRLEQRMLLDTVAEVLKPGEPAFDLLVQDEMIRICAWCYRVRTSKDTWLPIAHYVPSDSEFGVSHGICDVCRDQYFPT